MRAHRYRVDFTPGEVQLLDFITQTMLRGGTPTMATRHKEFASMCRKILQMKEKSKVDVLADVAAAKLCKHCKQDEEGHMIEQGHWRHDPVNGHLYRCLDRETFYEAKGKA